MGTKYNGALPPKYDNMTMWIDADNPKSFNPGGLYGDDYPVAGASQTASLAETAQYFIKYTHNSRDSYPNTSDTITGLKDISPDGHNYVTYEQYANKQRVIGPIRGKWYFSANDPQTIPDYGMPNAGAGNVSGGDESHHPYIKYAFQDIAHVNHPQATVPSTAAAYNRFFDLSYEGMDTNGLVNGYAITNYYCAIAVGEVDGTSIHDNKLWQILINDNVIRSYSVNLADATDIVPLAPGMIVDCGNTFGHWEIGPAITTSARTYGAIYSFHPIRPAIYNTQFPQPKWSVDQFLLAQVPIKPTDGGNVFHKTCELGPTSNQIITSSAADKFWWGRTTSSTAVGDRQLMFHADATDIPTFDTTKYYYFYVYDEFGSLRIVARKNPSTSPKGWATIKYHDEPHGALIVGKQYAIVVHEGLETASSNHWPPVKYPDISLGSRGLIPLSQSFMRVGQEDEDDRIKFANTQTDGGIVANYFTLNCWVRMTFDTGSDTQWSSGSTTDQVCTDTFIDQQFGGSVTETTIIRSEGTFKLGINRYGRPFFTVDSQFGSQNVPRSQLFQVLSNGTTISGASYGLPGYDTVGTSSFTVKGSLQQYTQFDTESKYVGNRNRNWHMVSVTYDAVNDAIKLYVDGEIQTDIRRYGGSSGTGFEGLGQPHYSSYGRPVSLGQISENPSGNNSFDSSMVEVNQIQMWANENTDVVLSADEIKQLYESSRQRFNK
jgi:hypothetical protein